MPNSPPTESPPNLVRKSVPALASNVKPENNRSSADHEFFTPTLAFMGLEITIIAFFVALLLLTLIAAPDHEQVVSAGSGDEERGAGDTNEPSLRTAGGIMEVVAPSPSPSQASVSDSATKGSGGNVSLPLAPPPKKSNAFIVPGLPRPAANNQVASPATVGGGDAFADLNERLQNAGAKGGDVQISLAWNNVNDLDLHVLTPQGEKIWYTQRQSRCGGELDVDMNAGGATSRRPVENIYWPDGRSPTGRFRVFVHHYANHGGQDPTRFQVTIKVKGQSRSFSGALRRGQPIQSVHDFSFP